MVKKPFPSIADIHPVIRIVCLIIVSIFVVSAEPIYLKATLILLVIGFAMGAWAQIPQCMRVLMRLKWLFTTIFIIYLFLTPGRNIFPIEILDKYPSGSALNSLSASLLNDVISLDGLYLGVLRVCSLVILILTVNLLIQTKQHNELSYAIIWLLSPLKFIGCPVDRLAIRISLTFRYVSEFQQTLMPDSSNERKGLSRQENNSASSFSISSGLINKKVIFREALAQAIDKSVELVNQVLTCVYKAPVEPISQPTEQIPHVIQWLLPLALLGGYLSLL